MKTYKVIQCFTGGIGRDQIRMVVNHPRLELVGVRVFHEDKAGRDAGEIAGIGNIGLRTTSNLDDIVAMQADVVLYNPPRETYDEVIALLRSGKNVLTPAGASHPKLLERYEEIQSACLEGKSSFIGSGINPGYAPDLLAMVATAVCSQVDHVHVYAGGSVKNEALRSSMMGFGQSMGEASVNELFLSAVVPPYEQAARLLCEALNQPVDEIRVESSFGAAVKDIRGEVPVKPGQVAGTRLSIIATHNGKPRVTLENTWFLGEKNVDPEWLGCSRSLGWTVKVTGRPDVTLELDIGDNLGAGTELTAARIINTIPFVCEAKPGAITMLDCPIPRFFS